MKYEVNVTGVGGLVEELAKEGDLLIIYNDSIKDEDLREISITHTESKLESDIEVGDNLVIGDSKFKITAVGVVAQNTLRELGHCTLKFDGQHEVNLPGEIHVEGIRPEVKVGDVISIY